MTALDDALNSSAPLFDPVVITAEWLELPPGYAAAALPIDAISDLGQQIGPGGYVVEQSLDDALPDPVTMTARNDASGKFAADLVGRQANIADAWGWRTDTEAGTGNDDGIECTTPTDAEYGDYVIVAIACTTGTVLSDASPDAYKRFAYKLLGTFADGALTVWVWGRHHYTGAPAFVGAFPTATVYSWVSGALWARTAAGSVVPIVPGVAVGAAESVSGTAHTSPAATATRRGYVAGIFASLSATAAWTATSGATEVAEQALTADVMLSRNTFQLAPTTLAMTGTTSGATATAVMVAIPLGLGDRERMDGVEYFSPFNTDSPVYGFERDTAPVRVGQPVVTATGVENTNIFTGQMAATPIKSRGAEVSAFSQTRIEMDKSLVLPTVHGLREGGSLDWLVLYLMAHGGQYAGVAPSPQTRQWVPFYGSIHPFMDGDFGYPRTYSYEAGVETLLQPPPAASTAPFVKAMHNQQKAALTIGTRVQFDDQPRLDKLPGMVGEYNDFMSRTNSRGRMTVWLRGDVVDNAPASIGALDENFIFYYRLENQSKYGVGSVNRGGLFIKVLATGQIQLNLGSAVDGYASLNLTPTFLPQDGAWHFLGVAWDWDAGLIKVNMDSTTWSTSGWASTWTTLPNTDKEFRDSGGYLLSFLKTHVPTAEFQVETGPNVYTEGFARFWPTPLSPSGNATFRPTNQSLEVVADMTPVRGWETLAQLAQASLSAYRTNEEDNFEFLPLSYFGEVAQMTPSVVADTETNAAELEVVSDPTKTRNVVTLEYEETSVDTLYSRVLSVTSTIYVPRGVTYLTFPLDVPAVELLGASEPYGNTGVQGFDFIKLSSSEIASPGLIPTNKNFITGNTKYDGTGTNWDKTTLNARMVGVTSSTVTVRITNSWAVPIFLSNNGQGVPFLCVLGYAIRSTPTYTTGRDLESVAKRGERTLTTQVNWVQNNVTAGALAANLLNILARPREEVTVRVMGDPRRRPGQLVSIADAEGTRADGHWRILSITHQGNGPMYVQDLKMVRVLQAGVWGTAVWDNTSWGA